ncbi:MAG: preprotein translocase subunit SecE [Candidatus Hydrogenedentes bacterium]|nr:preprotein translocase subunit SecE [Candidatus Hydrogenedentota bacterium]
MIKRIRGFIEEVKTEMDKVTWPTKDDLKVSTQVTLILLGVVSGIIYVYDQVFQLLIIALLGLAS